MPTRFVYMESSPALKGRAKKFGARYRRMAVVEYDPALLPEGATRPARIDERAKGVVQIVSETIASVGKSPRSFGYSRRAELQEEARRLDLRAVAAANLEGCDERDTRPSVTL